MPNDLLVTTTDILGIEVAKDYSGASGIYVDNVNNIISITGDVGKEYSGVNPIVVNNDENLISANSAPIGVQEPLYFVQDDDEAVVIGLSGEYVTPSDIAGKMDTSSFESWQQGQYTNDLTAINAKIDEVSSNIPSIEGLATEQLVEETSATIVSQIPSTAGLASETYVQEQTSGKASKSDLETVSGDIVNLIPDVSNYYTKDETSGAAQLAEAFSQIGPGGDEEVNSLVHSNSATWNETSNVVQTNSAQWAEGGSGDTEVNAYVYNNSASIDGTTSVVQSNSGTWSDITAYQSNSASYLTAHQDLSDYATTATTNTLSEQIEELSGTISAKHTLSAGEGISFYEDDVNNITRIDCTVTGGGGGDAEVNALVRSNSGEWNSVSAKQDSLSFGFGTTSGSVSSINGSAIIDDYTYHMLNVNRVATANLNKAITANSGTWNTVTNKLDTTAFSDVSGTFLTAHQSLDGYATETLVEETSGAITSLIPTDYYPNSNPSGFISGVDLTPYQTIEGMTAYQEVGDYYSASNPSGFITGVDLSNYYTKSETSGASEIADALANIPTGNPEVESYVQTNSGTIDDTVTSYQTNSGTFLTAHQAISAEEWNSNYETVNTNSGAWGGEALPISAGPGIKVNLVDNTLVFSNDETVLWESVNGVAPGGTTKIGTLSEPLSNFKTYAIDVSFESMYPWKRNVFDVPNQWGLATNVPGVYFMGVTHSNSLKPQENNSVYENFNTFGIGENMVDFYSLGSKVYDNGTANTGLTGLSYVYRVVGINRIGG